MTSYMRQIIQKLVADKKKLAVMVSLMAVLLLLWGRLILKQVPRTAVASPEIAKSAEKWNQHAFAESRVMLTRVEVELPRTLQRDLFSLELTGYESTGRKPVVEVKPEKSDNKLSDEEAMAQMVRQAATGMKLQTTILAQQPLALINGTLVQQGMEYKGFKVVRIMDRKVVLEMNEIQITLEM